MKWSFTPRHLAGQHGNPAGYYRRGPRVLRHDWSPFIPFLMAAALYLLCTFLLIFVFSRAERRWLAFIRRG